MDEAPAAQTDETWTPLIDVSGVPIQDLIDGKDTVLVRALRQVLASLDDPNGVISAFQSFPAAT